MNLLDFVATYLNNRPCTNGYGHTLQKRSAKLAAFAGRHELAAVFNEATINAFLASLTNLSPVTRNRYRANFLALWRAAADGDLVGYPMPRRIRREKVAKRVINCYVENEARALVVAAEHLGGAYPSGVARRQYWPAIIRAAWDTGLRRGDLWRIRQHQIRKDRSLIVVQGKTNSDIVCRLHPSTVRAIQRAGASLEWPLCEWCFSAHFQEIVTLSGLCRGTFRWLRRGSGSTIDAKHPGNGHLHLGNTRAVFEEFYDAKLGASCKPMPPEL